MTGPVTLKEEEQSFYAALGRAITQWQKVEEWLAIIFVGATGGMGPNGSAVLASFHAVINLNTKVAMVEAALSTKVFLEGNFPDKAEDNPGYTAWSTIKNRLAKRSRRRNELAHFSLHVKEDNPVGSRFYLSPSSLDVNTLIKERGKSPKWKTADLNFHGQKFCEMALELQGFYARWLTPK